MPGWYTKIPGYGSVVKATGLLLGRSGSAMYGITKGTVSINPASIAATSRAATTFTVTGAASGDILIMSPPAGLNDDLLFVGARVTGTDQGTVYLYNPTGGAIDDGALTWDYVLIEFS